MNAGLTTKFSAALNSLAGDKVDQLFTLASKIVATRRDMVAKEKDSLKREEDRVDLLLDAIHDDRERYRRDMEVLVPEQASLIAQQARLVAGLRSGKTIPAIVDTQIAQRSSELQARSSEALRRKEDVDSRLSQFGDFQHEIDRRSANSANVKPHYASSQKR